MQQQHGKLSNSSGKTCKSFSDLRKSKIPSSENESYNNHLHKKQYQCDLQERAILSPLSPTSQKRGVHSVVDNPTDFHLSSISPAHNCEESVVHAPSLLYQGKSNSQSTSVKEKNNVNEEYLLCSVNEGMNNGSKSDQSRVPSEMKNNISSPVGATSNSHIQKETLSHERVCAGGTSATLQKSPSSVSSHSVTRIKSPKHGVESTAIDPERSSNQQGDLETNDKLSNIVCTKSTSSDSTVVSSTNVKNKTIANIGDHSTKTPSYGYPNSPKLTPRSISADASKRNEGSRARDGSVGTNADAGGSKQDPVKSKKFVKHWKEAASMSKFGNRTKTLLGKFKPHSASVDMVAGNANTHNSAPVGMNRYFYMCIYIKLGTCYVHLLFNLIIIDHMSNISSIPHGSNSIINNPYLPKNTKNGTATMDGRRPKIESDHGSMTDMHAHTSTTEKSSSGKKGNFKQHTPVGQSSNTSASGTPVSKAKTQWSEHVWSKYLYYTSYFMIC